MPITLIVAIAVSWMVSLVCLVVLWRRPLPVFKKLFWAIELVFPVFGPLFFGGFSKPPKPLDEADQAKFDLSRHAGP